MAYIRQVLEGKQPAIKDLPGAVDLDDLSPRLGPSSVEFRNVSFSYKDEAGAIQPGMESEVPALLRGISFTIEPGMNVALVGPSGSGEPLRTTNNTPSTPPLSLSPRLSSLLLPRQVHDSQAHHKDVGAGQRPGAH